jgi:hypothetical protein
VPSAPVVASLLRASAPSSSSVLLALLLVGLLAVVRGKYAALAAARALRSGRVGEADAQRREPASAASAELNMTRPFARCDLGALRYRITNGDSSSGGA